ncbi:MAG: undecaprenyl-diphosphate phosphatase [Alphaproteobacteria bacterium]|nr:undecaprenyl-diphosphate phosphatase [Alphaproteobacteria bacterium]
MISLTQVIIIALIQGLTEFLPVSSSAHLLALPKYFGWPQQGQAIDVAVHFGTLGAVVIYFWRDLVAIIKDSFHWEPTHSRVGRVLCLQLIIATIPAVVAGAFINYLKFDMSQSLTLIAWSSIIFGSILYLADSRSSRIISTENMTYSKALFVGIIQVFAFIPGASRSGSCLTALRILGFNRFFSVRYSCLMSIPLILAAATLITYKIIWIEHLEINKETFYAVGLSFLAGLASIAFMMRWIQEGSFSIFAIYRILFGLGLLGLAKNLV